MRQSDGPPEPDQEGVRAWFLFWLQLAILAMLALVGAFVAADSRPGDYTTGLTLSFASLGLAMLVIRRRFDGETPGWSGVLLVDDWPNWIAVTIIFAIVAVIGILVAAGLGRGSLYDAGIALAVASALGVFLSLKNVFDKLDRRQ